jgi:hypothetical protein
MEMSYLENLQTVKDLVETGETELTVSSDGRWILYTQLDQFASSLILVENFR